MLSARRCTTAPPSSGDDREERAIGQRQQQRDDREDDLPGQRSADSTSVGGSDVDRRSLIDAAHDRIEDWP